MRTRAIILTAAAIAAAAALTACEPVKSTTTSTATDAKAVPAQTGSASAAAQAPAPAGGDDKLKDVEIAACNVDDTLHWPSADVTITNHTSKSSNYLVNVEFVDASGTRIGEGVAATSNLAAGQAAKTKAQGAVDAKGQKVSCKVTSVTRYAAQ